MSEPTDYQAWAMRAEEDYLLCRSALRRKVPLLYGATFHAQQCAEKYLKALLVVYGRALDSSVALRWPLAETDDESATGVSWYAPW